MPRLAELPEPTLLLAFGESEGAEWNASKATMRDLSQRGGMRLLVFECYITGKLDSHAPRGYQWEAERQLTAAVAHIQIEMANLPIPFKSLPQPKSYDECR